jgi:hypothetical protein
MVTSLPLVTSVQVHSTAAGQNIKPAEQEQHDYDSQGMLQLLPYDEHDDSQPKHGTG